MKKTYVTVIVSFLLMINLFGQSTPSKPIAPTACNDANCTIPIAGNPWDQCIAPNGVFVSDFRNGQLCGGTSNSAGSVYRYKNVGNVNGTQINATITVDIIFQAVLDNIDDDASDDPAVNIEFFAPRIGTDAATLTTTDRRGYVQFTIRFYTEAAPLNTGFHTGAGAAAANNADFTTTIPLSNLNMIHYDNDGNEAGDGAGGAWFRETGTVLRNSVPNISVVAAGVTELQPYNYTDGTNNFSGFAGSVCERDNVSRCTQVAEYYRFNTAANQITFRLGYDYQGSPTGSGTTAPRQFGTRFNCVNLPGQGTLPLTITNFGVNHKDGVATLSWTTVDELDFNRFEIERSTNGADFIAIANVAGKGAGRESAAYQFADDIRTVSGTAVFYRLRMVDDNGKFVYSNTVSLRRGNLGNGKLNISPNPATASTVIRFRADRSGNADIVISDAVGRTIFFQRTQFNSGDNNFTVPEISGLPDGIYTIRLIYGNETLQERLVVRR